jgi:hypothetical protein
MMASGSDMPGSKQKENAMPVDAGVTRGPGIGLTILCIMGFAAVCEVIFIAISTVADKILGR